MFDMNHFTSGPLQSVVPPSASKLQSDGRKRRKSQSSTQLIDDWQIERLPRALHVAWPDIKDCSQSTLRAGFHQIITQCEMRQKQEFVVENIAPDYKVEDGNPTILMAAQMRIASIFYKATEKRFLATPEHRLSRRGDAFDLRFYLWQTRPTDFLRTYMDY